jgi:hypothetical protein
VKGEREKMEEDEKEVKRVKEVKREEEKPVELSDSAGDVGSRVDSGRGRRSTRRIDQDRQVSISAADRVFVRMVADS